MKLLFSEEHLKISATLILRYGMALVFLWFGFSQLHNPTQWVAFLPSFINTLPVSEIHFVMFNGLFEVVGASLILIGAYTRISALLLGLHLLGIALSIGITSVGVRDFGLTFATLALAGLGAGPFSIDALVNEEKVELKLGEVARPN